jgi:hypothetical protein
VQEKSSSSDISLLVFNDHSIVSFRKPTLITDALRPTIVVVLALVFYIYIQINEDKPKHIYITHTLTILLYEFNISLKRILFWDRGSI